MASWSYGCKTKTTRKQRKKEEEIHNQSNNNQKQLTHTQKTEQIIEKRK